MKVHVLEIKTRKFIAIIDKVQSVKYMKHGTLVVHGDDVFFAQDFYPHEKYFCFVQD